MSNLGNEKPQTGVDVWSHALSSLIAQDAGDAVVVSVASLSAATQVDARGLIRAAESIAAACSSKFVHGRNQPHLNWVVVYMSELECFVGVLRTHKSLRK